MHWDEFQISVSNLKPDVYIFVLTEIAISSVQCDQFMLNGYKEHFFTRENNRGGGIALYIKDKWLSSSSNVSFQHAESLAIKIHHP